jgi:hypothetical protein
VTLPTSYAEGQTGHLTDHTSIAAAIVGTSSDVVRYVGSGTNASDSNSGLTPYLAKATVQSAYDALPSTGGTIWVISALVTLATGSVGFTITAGKPVHLRGLGTLATELRYTGTGVAIKLDGTGTDPNDWGSIQDLKVNCTAAAATKGLYLIHAHRGHLKNVYFLGKDYTASSRGLHCDNAYGNYVKDCVIAGWDTCVDLDGGCHDFTILDTNMGGQTCCVRVKDSTDIRLHGGQHSGTGSTVGLIAIATDAASDSARGLEVHEIHYEGNGLDVAIGRVGDGSTQSIQSPYVATPCPQGATFDRCYKPVIMGMNVGNGSNSPVLTLTSNCSDPVLISPRFASGATLSDSSTRPTIISDVNGRVGIGTTAPGARLHVSGSGVLVDNNQSVQFKDSGGTARRLVLLTGGNAFDVGDIDNAMNSDLNLFAGGTGLIHGNVNGTDYFLVRAGNVDASAANVRVTTAGKGLQVKEGSNARLGTATLSGGTVTVSNTSVTASTRILLTVQSLGTVAAPKAVAVTARVNGTSFTITSADATDTSVVAWHLVEGI